MIGGFHEPLPLCSEICHLQMRDSLHLYVVIASEETDQSLTKFPCFIASSGRFAKIHMGTLSFKVEITPWDALAKINYERQDLFRDREIVETRIPGPPFVQRRVKSELHMHARAPQHAAYRRPDNSVAFGKGNAA